MLHSYRIGDDAEVFFYLYDAHPSKQREISERFLVRITREGFSTNFEDMPLSNCSSTVFSDLGMISFLPQLI
jgi:dedicator of cytokinesis protein 3